MPASRAIASLSDSEQRIAGLSSHWFDREEDKKI
jgi:hypothetical protein